MADSPDVTYPSCRYCNHGKIIDVVNKLIDTDDENLTDTMTGKQWLYTGTMCDHCEATKNGSFVLVQPQ